MEIREFQAVDAVARYKSITRAAEKMNISQQGLSGIIRKMEAECGFRIFERTPAGSRLTEEGEKLIRYITPVLAEYELAVGRIRKIQVHTGAASVRLGVSVGAFHTIGYHNGNALLAQLRKSLPDALIIGYEYPDMVIEQMLLQEELDCALTLKPRTKGILFNTLKDIRMSVYMGKGHPLADRDILTFKDLKNERFAMVTKDMQFRIMTEERCVKAGYFPSIIYVASEIFSIIEKLKTGEAVFVGANTIPTGNGITRVYLDEPDFYWSIGMAYTKDTLKSPEKSFILRCMSDFFRENMIDNPNV